MPRASIAVGAPRAGSMLVRGSGSVRGSVLPGGLPGRTSSAGGSPHKPIVISHHSKPLRKQPTAAPLALRTEDAAKDAERRAKWVENVPDTFGDSYGEEDPKKEFALLSPKEKQLTWRKKIERRYKPTVLSGLALAPSTGASEPHPGSWLRPKRIVELRDLMKSALEMDGQRDDFIMLVQNCKTGDVPGFELKEFEDVVRNTLKIKPQLIRKSELKVLFGYLDRDKGGTVDLLEFADFITNGKALHLEPRSYLPKSPITVADIMKDIPGIGAGAHLDVPELDIDEEVTPHDYESPSPQVDADATGKETDKDSNEPLVDSLGIPVVAAPLVSSGNEGRRASELLSEKKSVMEKDVGTAKPKAKPKATPKAKPLPTEKPHYYAIALGLKHAEGITRFLNQLSRTVVSD